LQIAYEANDAEIRHFSFDQVVSGADEVTGAHGGWSMLPQEAPAFESRQKGHRNSENAATLQQHRTTPAGGSNSAF